MLDLAGLIAPLMTPFTDDGSSVSEVRLSRLVRHLNEHEISGYVVGSDSGEWFTLSASERKTMVELAIREAQGRPVLAHVSAIATSTALDLAQHAARHGARAAIVMPPVYVKLSQEDLVKTFETLAAYAGLPVAVVDPENKLSPETKAEIAHIPEMIVLEPAPIGGRSVACSDEFRTGSAVCMPAAMLVQHGEAGPIADLMHRFGGARIGKAAFQLLDLDLGPTRPPLRPLPNEAMDELRNTLPKS